MRRTLICTALLALLFAGSSAQFRPQVVIPDTDPNAFKITTQADLEDALSRIARLKQTLRDAKDADERKFLLTSILERCQNELNRERNTSGVVIVERAPQDSKTPGLPIRWQGAFSAIEDQIRSLGGDALQLYEELYGPRVQLLMADALQTRDHTRLADLNRRFGLTRAGARAAVTLATMLWEDGKLSQAARMLERSLENTTAFTDSERANLYAWLSHCYRERGERANLQRLIDQSATLSEATVRHGDSSGALGALLKQRLSEARDGTTETIDRLGVQWIGGNYANTGLHERPSTYDKVAWTRPLPQLSATPHTNAFMDYRAPIVPPHLPLFDGSMIYVNIGDALVAYDLINGARGPMWTCKPFPTFEVNWRTIEPDPSMILPVSTWRGTVFAALENPLSTAYHNMYADRNFNLYSHYPKVRRALCAVDGATGRLLWKLGGQYEGDELSTVNFMSAVVYEGVLYAIATRVDAQSDIFLYALDPDNGNVHWNLRLCYGQQETTMFGRPAREPHPSLPAISGSLLYVCTNIGGVVAVDLNTRGLRWISRYEYMPRPVSKYTSTYYRDVTWFNSPTIYAEHEGRAYVIVAPTDADYLFAMDAATGEHVWQLRREEQLHGGRALVGTRAGVAFVAGDGGSGRGGGSSMLHLVDVPTGRIARSATVTQSGRAGTLTLAGRPSLAANHLLWPGIEQWGGCAIAEVNLDTLKTARSVDVPQSYGSQTYSVFTQHGVVFTVAGRNYSRGNIQLDVRFDVNELIRTTTRELAQNPQNAEVHLRLGLLTMRTGTRADGLALIRKAYELAEVPPANTRVRDQASHALVGEYLSQADAALARRNWAEAVALMKSAREYAVTRAQRTECFLREESAVAGRGNAGELIDFYREVVRTNPDFGIGEDPELPAGMYATIRVAQLVSGSRPAEAVALYHSLLGAGPRLQYEGVPLRLLALDRLRTLLKEHGREVFTEQERAAEALVAKDNQDAWRQTLERYPLSTAADTALFRLAEQELHNFRPEAAAEMIRTALDEFGDRVRLADLNVLMAVAYSRAGQGLRARLIAGRVLRTHPNGKLILLKREQTYEELLKPLIAKAAGADLQDTLPRLPAALTEIWSRPWPQPGGFTRLPPQPPTGGRVYAMEISRSALELVALDVKSGDPAWPPRQINVTLSGSPIQRTPQGTLLPLNQGFMLIDDEGGERWSVTTAGPPTAVSLHGGMLVYCTRLYNTRAKKSLLRVSALDAASGGEIWQQEAELEGNNAQWIGHSAAGIYLLVFGQDTRLVMLSPESGEVRASAVIPMDGRTGASPVVTGEHVLVPDRLGRLHAFDIEDLAEVAVHETRITYPSTLELRGDHVIIVGNNSAAAYSLLDNTVKWRVGFPVAEALTGNRVLKDTLVLATRNSNGQSKIHGYDLKDGKPAFTYPLERENDNDRIDLGADAVFDDGFAAVYIEQRIVDGRLRLWGFRLIVLNADGTERLNWQYRAQNNAAYVQLAVTEDCLVVALDQSVTVGFGAK